MRLTTGRTKLKQSHENLMLHWEDTRAGWADDARRAFEKDHLEALTPEVESALRSIDRLSTIISRMLQECS
jgi:hypothetical protein